mmetsp:Transcript_59964/g.143186  ORF Transcript_59964/g.143186 Transcript_59964/m.143186 type:complete len:256 (+) Transcript_59964:767-1534(+)
MAQSTQSFDESTKTHSAAPRLSASIPTEPVPVKRSRWRTERSSKRCMAVTWLKRASRTRSIVGLTMTPAGCSSRRRFAVPVLTRSREGKAQFLCASGGPCFKRHSTFCLERLERPQAWPGPPLTLFVGLVLLMLSQWLGTSTLTSSLDPGASVSSCEDAGSDSVDVGSLELLLRLPPPPGSGGRSSSSASARQATRQNPLRGEARARLLKASPSPNPRPVRAIGSAFPRSDAWLKPAEATPCCDAVGSGHRMAGG